MFCGQPNLDLGCTGGYIIDRAACNPLLNTDPNNTTSEDPTTRKNAINSNYTIEVYNVFPYTHMDEMFIAVSK